MRRSHALPGRTKEPSILYPVGAETIEVLHVVHGTRGYRGMFTRL